MARDKYLEKFIDAGFADLKQAIVEMKEESSSRHTDNQNRLTALEKDMGFLKSLFKGVCTLIAAVASAVGIWKGMR